MNAPIFEVARTAVTAVPGQVLLYLECEIALANGQVLGSETFRLVSFEGKEHVSEPFEFSLILHGDTDPAADALVFSRLIGRPVNVGIGMSDAPAVAGRNVYVKTNPQGEKLPLAIFNGMVASFGMQEPGVYQLVMRPALWRMSLTNNYRMHRQMNVCEVLAALCREHRVNANFDAIGGPDNIALTRVQDWLQAGESDYEFMRRLMGKAHVFFYFTHQYGQHMLVFANRASYPVAIGEDRALRYTWTSEEELGLHQSDVISQYSFQQSLGCSGVHGVFTSEEQAASVDNRIASYASFRAASAPDVGELPFHQYRVFQYGGSNNEVRHYTLASQDALQTANSQLSGASYCPLLRVGHQFRMTAAGQPVRPELERAHFVLTEVSHHATLDGEYSNQFQASDAAGLITPLSISDTQQGAVLAKVVALRNLPSPRGWPYYTPDNFDMQEALLQDAQGVSTTLQAKGVYVRFSTEDDGGDPVWVKLMPSMQTVPEVGTMVLVSRANDESELPEIQAIHSDGSSVVTPSDWTAHTQVGNSFSTSYGDGKSIRFGTRWSGGDTDVAIKIVESAYDRKLFRDASYSRGGSYSYSCSEDMEKGMLGESWSYGSNYSNSWSKESKSFSATARSYHESVTGVCDLSQVSTEATEPEALAAVQASKSVVIGDTYSTSKSTGKTKGVSTYNGSVENITTHNGQVSSSTTHNGKVSGVTTINADSENTSTVTGTSTTTTTHAIVHNFTAIGAQSSSTAIGASNSNDSIGISNGNSATGVRNQNSLTGVVIETSLQGSVNNASITGISAGLSVTGSNNSLGVTGDHNAVTVTGASTTVNVVGESTSVDILSSGLSLSVKGAMVSIDISGPSIKIPIIMMVM
jgi:hypothetical protein